MKERRKGENILAVSLKEYVYTAVLDRYVAFHVNTAVLDRYVAFHVTRDITPLHSR